MWFKITCPKKITVVKTKCPLCSQVSHILLWRKETFGSRVVIPYWLEGNVCGTCENCHKSFEFEQTHIESYLNKNNIECKDSNIGVY
ncbi:MAG TPA: hypothetical protein VMT31_02350 [Methanomicrobiales archaeon]|nr:hypothetical protein [Methanomicrobiales archaeon]